MELRQVGTKKSDSVIEAWCISYRSNQTISYEKHSHQSELFSEIRIAILWCPLNKVTWFYKKLMNEKKKWVMYYSYENLHFLVVVGGEVYTDV